MIEWIRWWFRHRWLEKHSQPGHKTTSWGVDVDSGKDPYWTCICGAKRVVP